MKKLLSVVVVSIMAFTTTQANAIGESKTRPILLVHGLNPVLQDKTMDCETRFGPLKKALRANGFTGEIKTVTYYKQSTNCDVNLANLYPEIQPSSTWKEVGAKFSHYVFYNYTRFGKKVDMVGHSMGGLVIRSAVQGGREGQPGFWSIAPSNIVTVATPHLGSSVAQVCTDRQCLSLLPSNPDFAWLQSTPNPQSNQPIIWSVQGSNTDPVVTIDSALALDTPNKTVMTQLNHSNQLTNAASVNQIVNSLAIPNN